MTIRQIACLIFTSTLTSYSFGCPFAERGNLNKPELYSSIISGKVEHLELSVRFSDLTPPYKVHVSEIKVLHGILPKHRTLEIGSGCGFIVPKVGDTVVFFISKKKAYGKFRIIPMRLANYRSPKKPKKE